MPGSVSAAPETIRSFPLRLQKTPFGRSTTSKSKPSSAQSVSYVKTTSAMEAPTRTSWDSGPLDKAIITSQLTSHPFSSTATSAIVEGQASKLLKTPSLSSSFWDSLQPLESTLSPAGVPAQTSSSSSTPSLSSSAKETSKNAFSPAMKLDEA